MSLLLCLSPFLGATLSGADDSTAALKIEGWKQSGKTQVFSPRTLYRYIDGGADLYLKYDFQELQVTEYRNEKDATVLIEVYRHRTANQAFGIYSQERLSNARYLDIGGQGYIEDTFLNFVSGNFYVKMSSENVGPQMEQVLLIFAGRILEKLGTKGGLPTVLSAFPEEGKKKNTEKFIFRDFLGYSFFHSGFTANYELAGKKFQLFIIEADGTNDAAAMINRYFQQLGRASGNPAEGTYQLSDPYHGPIDMAWKGKYIWGVLNLTDPALRSKYLQLLGERMGTP